MNNKIWIIAGIAILAIAAFFMLSNPSTTGNTVVSEVLDEGQTIKIPLSEISDTASFYNQDGIKFFAVKASNGEIKTAFDACDVCGGTKGYRQEGTDMICNNCGRHFKIDQLGEDNIYGGGCWPGFLENTIENDYLIVQKSDLESGGYQF